MKLPGPLQSSGGQARPPPLHRGFVEVVRFLEVVSGLKARAGVDHALCRLIAVLAALCANTSAGCRAGGQHDVTVTAAAVAIADLEASWA